MASIQSHPMKNKLIYVQKSPAAMKAPKLKGRMKIMVACEDGTLKNLPIPKSCRAVVSEIIQFVELDTLCFDGLFLTRFVTCCMIGATY